MRRGERILHAGQSLQPQAIGVLGTVGRAVVPVIPSPRVCILPTGDEMVEPGQEPGPAQIRNSNGPMLMAQVRRAGGQPHYLGIARDRLDSLRPLVVQGLQADVLILSGGVSAGKLDLVPGVLQEAGVRPHFHKVEMKPGKPLFFGTAGERTLVFGLPGNPVSSFVCFELFVRPGLRRLRGLAEPGPRRVTARLAEDFPYRTERITYHPAVLEGEPGASATGANWRVRVLSWFGSADLRGLLPANALLELPIGDHRHRAGQEFEVVCLDNEP
jgi:molybdopterin molybdotransferase